MVDQDLVRAANGETNVDILIRNAKIVNTFSGEIYNGHVAICGENIVGIGDYPAVYTIDLEGQYLAPGFIDAHVHLESSMVSPEQYARSVVRMGTTTVIADPHEIANVAGLKGIEYMLDATQDLPIEVYFMVPSCVPATALETGGATLAAKDLAGLRNNDRILGLGEVMNYPGVVNCSNEVLDKIRLFSGKVIDGHAPGLSGKALNAYISAGPGSDHECTTIDEALEKLRAGMQIFIREGTSARNLADLIKLVNANNYSWFSFASDDKHPQDLLTSGHIDHMIKMSIRTGLPPVNAIRIATLNPSRYFGLKRIGAIAPGYMADLVAFDSFDTMKISRVFKKGKIVVDNGEVVWKTSYKTSPKLSTRFNIADFDETHLQVKTVPGKLKVIRIIPGQILTGQLFLEPKNDNGYSISDVDRDVLKMAVVERHHGTGNVGLGFVNGFGMQKGALASSVAHDSHNIVVIGANDADMILAVSKLAEMNGGQLVANGGNIVEALPLPIGGLMSSKTLENVARRIQALNKAAHDLGCILEDPFMTLSFLSLPVIPELKLTDLGLVDVKNFKITDLFE